MFFERRGELFIGRFGELLKNRDVFHGFSTRKGGVSKSLYNWLNLGDKTSDLSFRVRENRRGFFSLLGVSEVNLAIPQQVHGDRILRVTEPGNYPETDGLITNTPGIGLIVQVADCVPLFFYDSFQKAVGLVHAGWRGTMLKISAKAVQKMGSYFGTNPKDLQIFVGPSIGPCCYEVGSDVASRFPRKYIIDKRLDLWRSNRDQLLKAGVKPDKIVMSNLCTACHPEWFFSYRASGGETGRMMAVLGLGKKKLDFNV